MQHILDYLKSVIDPKDSWVIVGKGPKTFSVEKVLELSAKGYKLCSLNDSYTKVPGLPFDLCVFNDWQVATWLSDTGRVKAFTTTSQAHHWVPEHYKTLPGLLQCMKPMNELAEKLYMYDTLGSKVCPEYPNVFTCTSSSESAFDLLARAGIRDFYFVGVDGGRGYHPSFKSPTSNDLTGQFRGLARIARAHNVLRIQGLPHETWERYFQSSGVEK